MKLSLVSVPVRAFTAHATEGEVRLNQLHDACNHRVKYVKTCPEHGEIGTDEIVSGYEYAKGQYVRIDLDELKKLRKESDRSVQIRGFFPPDQLDPIYHAGRTYYLLPDGAVGGKPYALLLQAMLDEGLVALAQVVLTGREQLVLLRPHADLLLMTVLHHAAKVKEPAQFRDELEPQELGADELELTRTLLRASKLEELDYESYEDRYVENLKALIRAKVDGEELVQVPDAEEPAILNLMDALVQSVAKARSGEEAAAEPPAKQASGRRKAASRKRKSG